MISDLRLATCAHGGQRIVKRRRSRELRKGGKRTKSTNAGQYFFSAYKRNAQSKENISAPCSRKQKMPGQLRNDRGEDKALVEVAPALRDRIAAASSTELPRKRIFGAAQCAELFTPHTNSIQKPWPVADSQGCPYLRCMVRVQRTV